MWSTGYGTRSSGVADRSEAGLATVQHVLAAALAMLLFAALANVITVQYVRGAVRAALDEGVRQGSLLGAGAIECEERIDAALADLLAGPYGAGIELGCREDGGWIRAQASGRLPVWVLPVDDLAFRLEAQAVRESP